MPPPPPAEELADLRRTLARLHRREAELQRLILANPDLALPPLKGAAPRPGWPIRRDQVAVH